MSERLRLYYPVKPFSIAQNFGDNVPCVKDFGLPTQWISDSYANGTCPVGYDKLYSHFGMSGHNGMDIRAGEWPVYAACDGVVVEKQTVPARGLGLGILTNKTVLLDDSGEYFAKLRYWHLKSFYVEVGNQVVAGQMIGVSDNTGYSSGNHLHFELQPMDKDAGGHPMLAFPNNGIGAAINPAPFFTGISAVDVPTQISTLQKMLTELIALLQSFKK